MHISTVRIRSVETASGFIVINEADFDPSKHQLWKLDAVTRDAGSFSCRIRPSDTRWGEAS